MSFPYLFADALGVVRSQFDQSTVEEILRAGGPIFDNGGQYTYDSQDPETPWTFEFFGSGCQEYADKQLSPHLFQIGDCTKWVNPPFTRKFKTLLELALYAAFDGVEHG